MRKGDTMASPGAYWSSALGAAVALALSGACSSAPSPAPTDVAESYLDDAQFRRAELVASLVNPSNDYWALRLAHYATGDAADWDRLPEWNPPTAPVARSELDANADADAGAGPTMGPTRASPASAAALDVPASIASLDDPALLALGKAAFDRYPTQPAPYFDVALASPDAAGAYGLWVDVARGVGGLVRAQMGDGSWGLSLTCSSCHAAPSSGGIEPGLPNAALQLGTAVLLSQGLPANTPPSVSPIAAWGPGRVDVTTSTGTEPARIPDLRPVRYLGYLQQDATVRARDIIALAIRIETLIITSNEAAVRPPRTVALGLAVYLTSLSDGLPSLDAAAAASPQGAALFAAQCAPCHVPPALTGDPVALAVVGTDPTLGLSADRGTGMYRVPSLHGVGTRGPLLHDATLPSVDMMFDPSRLTPAFAGGLHGSGPVEGHPFGLDLGAADRDGLVSYLHAL